MGILPSLDRAVAESAALVSFRTMIDSAGFRFLPPVPQASLRWAVTCVTAVEAGTVDQLKLKSLSSDAMVIWQACWIFLQFDGSLDGKQEPKLHCGVNACLALLQHCLFGKAEQGTLDPQIAMLEKFSFLVPTHRSSDLSKVLKMRAAPKAKAKAKAKASSKAADAASASAGAMFA